MRVILHADMDAFYASVEQRNRPELRGRPVVVGGTSERGVVSAASYEARRFGVHSAMPTVQARALCPEAIFVRGDMRRYADESKRIFEVFRRFSPLVEGLSLDEAFLDLTGTQRLFGPPLEVGRRLRAAVRDETELAVSVGIAPIKMVAKIASDLAKPDGLLEVSPDRVREFLEPLPVGRIWGVGPVARERLAARGIHSVGELARVEPQRIERELGRWGLELARLARGDDLREVAPWREPVSYSEENTFRHDVSDREVLEATLVAHAEAVARRLRRDALVARTVVVKLKLARRRKAGPRGYPLLTRRETLPEATDDGAVLSRTGSRLLDRAALREPVRLLGVGATNLRLRSAGQLDLFAESAVNSPRRSLNRALDEIRDRFGDRAIARGAVAEPERAGLSQQHKRGV
ncbi:MAG: DNA polymerase IV [Myxococcota bacterium]|mgnify:CR=1 FL=1|jgi:DNA polymerase-4|nr:DNA polymerase IV [Deltaproteobacteria bacterium]MCP4243217.1 DNA polymerase IV [bacterium]MDP6076527.1 DNA polymerase IV [Myxococcota bacterium]MDP7075707.1 DNA polymerase IV [Myxococcota bacterium]MDP7297935.1 DNA polymerase IV [Myxococcota bacterium]